MPTEGLFRSPVIRELASRNDSTTKAHVLATLIVRGNALAVLVVGSMRLFDLIYSLCDPVYAPRMKAPGAMRYSAVVLTFEFALSYLLFLYSRRIGGMFLRDLDALAPKPD